jgi:hypothetical protein
MASGKHETSRSWLRASKRDNKISAIFAGLDSAPKQSTPIQDLAKGSIQSMLSDKPSAKRQRNFRARKATEENATEVRGIFAHQDDHAAVKEAAAKISRGRQRAAKRAAP